MSESCLETIMITGWNFPEDLMGLARVRDDIRDKIAGIF